MEAALATAGPAKRAALLQRAGDLCASVGEMRRSLAWYGQAVDQYLALDESTQAGQICRMILHVQPETVRARCTLCWLDIVAGRHDEAADRVPEYADAAITAGQEEIAAQQLVWMFDAAPQGSRLRERIVFALFRMGENDRGRQLSIQSEPEMAMAASGRSDLWKQVLEGALAGA